MLSTSFLTKSKYTNGSTGQWGLCWEPSLPQGACAEGRPFPMGPVLRAIPSPGPTLHGAEGLPGSTATEWMTSLGFSAQIMNTRSLEPAVCLHQDKLI